MKKIFEYTNYRLYLKEFYEDKKSREGYTFRDFSTAAGMNSSSWLLHLIKGVKNLSNESTAKVAQVLGFSHQESEYFELLVHFTQAKSSDTKDYFYKKMMSYKRHLNIAPISDEHYDYYTKWYHPVVRSLVSKVSFGENYALLGRKLSPRITATEAKRSVKLLERLGLIQKDASGAWIQSAPVLSTGSEVMSLNVINYHKQVSKLAEDAFDRSPPELRDISALTMGIGEKEFSEIKAKVQAFRREIMEIAVQSKDPDRVYQLNFQFFPVSSWESGNHEAH